MYFSLSNSAGYVSTYNILNFKFVDEYVKGDIFSCFISVTESNPFPFHILGLQFQTS